MHETLAVVKALADLNRMRVLSVLMKFDELCVCQLTTLLGLATPTVSRHMSILHSAGLVRSRKEGRWVYYRLADGFPPRLRQWLAEALEESAEAESDRTVVARLLTCDPGELCRCQRSRLHTGA